MSFGGASSGGSSSISTGTDVALSNPVTGQVLAYDGALAKWKNSPDPIDVARLPSGSTLTVQKTSSWPARPTSRADITVAWKGPDPSPAIVTSGTGGMLNNVDIRLVTP